ncbi:hypothetical protein ACFXKF_21740 [Streptomyces scopuliridis]
MPWSMRSAAVVGCVEGAVEVANLMVGDGKGAVADASLAEVTLMGLVKR